MKLEDAGAIMRLMRRASHLALNDAKKNGLCKNPMDAAIMIYTDCPCTASKPSPPTALLSGNGARHYAFRLQRATVSGERVIERVVGEAIAQAIRSGE